MAGSLISIIKDRVNIRGNPPAMRPLDAGTIGALYNTASVWIYCLSVPRFQMLYCFILVE